MAFTDLRKAVPVLSRPVNFLEAGWDLTRNHRLARSYFDVRKAPVKGFYTFEKSAHCPTFEEPKQVVEILRRDVLNGRTRLASEVVL